MSNSSISVLVVDDMDANRTVLELDFRDRGVEVVCCDGGQAALECLGKRTFDALVTDIWMPSGDGIELLRHVREQHPHLLIYAVTGGGPGMSMASASALARVWDASKVYIMPFDSQALVDDLIADLHSAQNEAAGDRQP